MAAGIFSRLRCRLVRRLARWSLGRQAAGGWRLGCLAGRLPGLCDGAAPSKVEKMEAATARCRLVKE